MDADSTLIKRFYIALGLIALFGVALRIVIPFTAYYLHRDWTVFTNPDSLSYLNPAHSLAQSGEFAVNGQPEIHRTPGYPLLLVPGVWIGHLQAYVIVVQAFLWGGMAWMAGWLAFDLSKSPWAGLASAALLGVDLVSIQSSPMLVTESLFSFLVACHVLAIMAFFNSKRWRYGFLAAILAMMAIYVRPIGIWLPANLLAAGLLWSLRSKKWPLRFWLGVGLVVLVCLAGFSVWSLRNQALTGFKGFSAIGNESLYYYQAGALLAEKNGVTPEEQHRNMGWEDREVYLAQHPEQRGWSEAEILSYQKAEGGRIILAEPWLFAKVTLKTQLAYFTSFTSENFQAWFHLKGLTQYRAEGGSQLGALGLASVWLTAIQMVLWFAMLGLSFYFLLFIQVEPLFAKFILAVHTLGLLFSPLASQDPFRFKTPTMFLFSVMAGLGLACWPYWRKITGWRKNGFL